MISVNHRRQRESNDLTSGCSVSLTTADKGGATWRSRRPSAAVWRALRGSRSLTGAPDRPPHRHGPPHPARHVARLGDADAWDAVALMGRVAVVDEVEAQCRHRLRPPVSASGGRDDERWAVAIMPDRRAVPPVVGQSRATVRLFPRTEQSQIEEELLTEGKAAQTLSGPPLDQSKCGMRGEEADACRIYVPAAE